MKNPVQSLSRYLPVSLSKWARKPHSPHKNSQRSTNADATPRRKLSTGDFSVDPVALSRPVPTHLKPLMRWMMSTAVLEAKVADLIAKGDEFAYIDSRLFRDAAIYRTVPYDWATTRGGGELPCDV